MNPPRQDRDPEISVVIPTHGREERLAFALEALTQQTLDAGRFEVVVVRVEGSSGPFAEPPDGLEVRSVGAPRPSRPGQRNQGWRAARGAIVAFTDDDCRPAPAWLERLGSCLGASDDAFAQGRTVPDPDEAHLLHGLARSVRIEGLGPWFETCNIAYPRALLERLGGFDERFVASAEDTDLALRALDAGADARYCEEALVWHAVLPQTAAGVARSGWSRWATTPLLFAEHPQHRRHLVAGVFYNPAHASLLPLAAGAALAPRRPLAAALLASPWFLEGVDTRNLGPRGLLRQIVHAPARLVRDLAIAAGLARGAVRHRAPLI